MSRIRRPATASTEQPKGTRDSLRALASRDAARAERRRRLNAVIAALARSRPYHGR